MSCAALSRRALLAAVGAFAALPALAQELVELPISPARKAALTVWTPKAAPAGVILFSHGHGSWPDRYAGLVRMLTDEGFAVVAPLHVDSVRYPEREKFTLQASFGERIADMKAASAYAGRRWPKVPVAAAGHSMGTLIGLCLAGALPRIGAFRDPSVTAVLGYSSPGRIPGLVAPDAYAGVSVPVMIVTGDKDVVPTFAPDPADHLFPIETSAAGDKYGVVLAGGEHSLIGGDPPELYRLAVADGRSFLRAYLKGDAAARATLAARKDAPPERWIVR